MRLRHKIRKLVDGQSLASARKRTLRLLRANRFPLETKRVIETIDPVEFEKIRRRYAVADPGADWPKYLNLDRWIGVNIRRIRQLELDVARPKRILDLGCGAGYFLYIAQLLGHSGVGLDMDRLPMFREITRLLGVRRIVQQIKAFRPLPNFGQKFDVITLGGPGVGIFSRRPGEALNTTRSGLARIEPGIRRHLLHARAEGIFRKARRQNRRAQDYF